MGVRSDLDANFDFELVDEFLDHYSIMVDSMEVMIIDLSKPSMHVRSMDELFRVFNNIKSASGFLKIVSMSKLAEFVSDELEELKKSDEPISEDTTNWLLSISNIFSVWQNDLKLDNNLTPIKYSLLKIPHLDK